MGRRGIEGWTGQRLLFLPFTARWSPPLGCCPGHRMTRGHAEPLGFSSANHLAAHTGQPSGRLGAERGSLGLSQAVKSEAFAEEVRQDRNARRQASWGWCSGGPGRTRRLMRGEPRPAPGPCRKRGAAAWTGGCSQPGQQRHAPGHIKPAGGTAGGGVRGPDRTSSSHVVQGGRETGRRCHFTWHAHLSPRGNDLMATSWLKGGGQPVPRATAAELWNIGENEPPPASPRVVYSKNNTHSKREQRQLGNIPGFPRD